MTGGWEEAMGRIRTGDCATYRGAGGPQAPVIYLVDSPEHPAGPVVTARGRHATIVTVPVVSWNDSLTPWRAPGLHREGPDFGGGAATTLGDLLREVIPRVERDEGLSPTRRGICGYSLGGLFALYAFTEVDAFLACAGLSASVWYPGWVDHLRSLGLNGTGRFAFLSVGSREKHAPQPLLRSVQDDMGACAEILRGDGCRVEFEVGPGSHASHVAQRYDAGLSALDAWLSGMHVAHDRSAR